MKLSTRIICLIGLAGVLLVAGTSAQVPDSSPEPTPTPAPVFTPEEIQARKKPVTVDQGFVDDANQAFVLVSALKAELKQKQEQISIRDDQINELMSLVLEYAEADSRKKKKSIWKKIGNFIKGLAKTVVKPDTIKLIIDGIIAIKLLEKL